MESIAVVLLAFVANIPLGVWRSRVRKFSLAWMAAVHASVPFIVWLRLSLDLSYWLIPFTLAGAMAGQITGGRLGKGWNRRAAPGT